MCFFKKRFPLYLRIIKVDIQKLNYQTFYKIKGDLQPSNMAAHHGYPAGYLNSRGDSFSEAGSEMEMNRYPSQHSMHSYGPSNYSYVSGSRKSLYSTYTSYAPSQISYMLPIVTKQPNPEKRPEDNWGLACCSIFINPLFGIFAILLAEQSKNYFSQLNYQKASNYGAYAKGVAIGGIVTMLLLILLIIFMVLNNMWKFDY